MSSIDDKENQPITARKTKNSVKSAAIKKSVVPKIDHKAYDYDKYTYEVTIPDFKSKTEHLGT